jgi:uncharacterized phiE125 gp8 family phage protein
MFEGDLVLYTAPAVEPVTVSEAKTHLRVDTSDDDTYIGALITAVRMKFEEETGRALITQTYDYYLHEVPGAKIRLPKPPLQSVTSVKFVDTSAVETTVTSTDYIVDTTRTPGVVVLKYDKTWPSVTLRETGGVRIRFVAGYGLAVAVPELIKSIIKLGVGSMYENREGTMVAQGVTVMELPHVKHLWRLYQTSFRV